MILKLCLFITTVLVLVDFNHCYLYGLTHSLLMKTLVKTLPIDPQFGFVLLNSLPHIMKKYRKMQNFTGNPFRGILSETKDLVKESFIAPKVKENDVSFLSFNADKNELVPLMDGEPYGEEDKLFVLVHGWIEDTNDVDDWCKKMAAALTVNFKNSHVIVVDWGTSSNKYLYPLAASRTQAVGKIIAEKLNQTFISHKVPSKNVVLIGYDLGAHVCGFTSKNFFENGSIKLPLIIALDPSAILFEEKRPSQRLAKTDADTVIVVHTECSWTGYKSPLGTIDFYPNGGFIQPGCTTWNMLCNHRRSYELFTSAISNPNKYPTMKCKNYDEYKNGKCEEGNVFFGDISDTKEGQYYFETSDKPPFIKAPRNKWKWFRIG